MSASSNLSFVNQNDDQHVAVLGKGTLVTLKMYANKPYIDIRDYYKPDEHANKMQPTRRGITLTMEEWSALISQYENVELALRGEEIETNRIIDITDRIHISVYWKQFGNNPVRSAMFVKIVKKANPELTKGGLQGEDREINLFASYWRKLVKNSEEIRQCLDQISARSVVESPSA
jgi:hypothetical protein